MRSIRILAIMVGCAIALLATRCASIAKRRVETELAEAGIPANTSRCMAEIWASELSTGQIRGIGRFANAVRDEGRTLTLGRLIGHAREWNDAQALQVVTTSAARCAFR